MKVYVLIKQSILYGGEMGPPSVMGVFGDRASLDNKIEQIRIANPQYPLEQHSDFYWSIGPDEDEGFFGNRKQHLHAYETELVGQIEGGSSPGTV